MFAPQTPKSPTLKDFNLVYNPSAPSSAQMLENARLKADTARRQAVLADMRAKAKASPDEARLYDRKLGGNMHLILAVVRRDGSTLDFLVCDVTEVEKPDGGIEIAIVIPCPVCNLFQGHVGQNMTLQQSNRNFTLDDTGRGHPWVNPSNPKEVFTHIGRVNTHEAFTCGTCHTRWVIENNKLRRD